MDSNDLSVFFQSVAPLSGALNLAAPGLGTLAAAGFEAAGTLSAGKAVKDAAGNIPLETSPAMMKYMGEIERRKRSFESGSAYTSQMRELKNEQAATNQGIVRAAGGNTGAAISGLARAQQATMGGYGKITEAGEQRQDLYEQMYGGMLKDMEDRRLGIQMMKYSQQMQDARQNQANTSQALMNLLSVLKPGDFRKMFGSGSVLPNQNPQSSSYNAMPGSNVIGS